MSQRVLEVLRQQFGAAILETHAQFGDETAVVEPARWREIAQFLRDDPRTDMDMFIDLTAVDYPARRPRFEVVLHVRSVDKLHRIRLKARVGAADGTDVRIPSLLPVWSGAEWFEREAYDLLGVQFDGHPDLRRILLYEQFQGHPLRKDYPAGRVQPLVPFRAECQGKLAPFGPDEGMPFGRQTHDHAAHEPRADADEPSEAERA
jgi:NADH-quinone oxidoreductase subunit C